MSFKMLICRESRLSPVSELSYHLPHYHYLHYHLCLRVCQMQIKNQRIKIFKKKKREILIIILVKFFKTTPVQSRRNNINTTTEKKTTTITTLQEKEEKELIASPTIEPRPQTSLTIYNVAYWSRTLKPQALILLKISTSAGPLRYDVSYEIFNMNSNYALPSDNDHQIGYYNCLLNRGLEGVTKRRIRFGNFRDNVSNIPFDVMVLTS
ncbi:hypothetical protein ACTFIV_001377 [Dictyostelium citrinum]